MERAQRGRRAVCVSYFVLATLAQMLTFAVMLDAARGTGDLRWINGGSFAGVMQELGFDIPLRLSYSKPDKTTHARSGTEKEPTAVGSGSFDHKSHVVEVILRSSKDRPLSTRAICGTASVHDVTHTGPLLAHY